MAFLQVQVVRTRPAPVMNISLIKGGRDIEMGSSSDDDSDLMKYSKAKTCSRDGFAGLLASLRVKGLLLVLAACWVANIVYWKVNGISPWHHMSANSHYMQTRFDPSFRYGYTQTSTELQPPLCCTLEACVKANGRYTAVTMLTSDRYLPLLEVCSSVRPRRQRAVAGACYLCTTCKTLMQVNTQRLTADARVHILSAAAISL